MTTYRERDRRHNYVLNFDHDDLSPTAGGNEATSGFDFGQCVILLTGTPT